MSRTFQITFSGIVAALSTVVMLLAGIIPIATYALPALAGVFTIAIVIELNVGWAFAVYAVTGAISAFAVADKEAALLYILFLGYYPIVKALIERIKNKIVQFVLKFALFNAAAVGAYFLAMWLLQLPEDAFVIFGVHLPWVLLILGNAVFVIYDFALSGLVVLYVKRLHPMFSRWMKK